MANSSVGRSVFEERGFHPPGKRRAKGLYQYKMRTSVASTGWQALNSVATILFWVMQHLARLPIQPLVAAAMLLYGCKVVAFAGTENYLSQLGTLTATISPQGQNASGLISWSASARFTAASPADIQTYLGRGCKIQTVTSCGVLILMYWVDGALVSQQLGVADATITFDTTALLNGLHEFVTTAWTDQPNSQIIAVVQQSINVNHGRAPMAVSSGWNEILLAPGQKQSLRPTLTYTNGDQFVLTSGVSYLTDSPGVATVSADGTLVAVSSGVAKLTTSAQGMTATTRVIVDSPYGFPHFARDGGLLTQYDPKRSFFLRSVFGITPDEVSGDMSLATSAKSAGVNAYTTGFYGNPADSGVTDFGKWQIAWDDTWKQRVSLARSQGVSLFLTGDDIARQPYQLNNSIANDWSSSAIQHAFLAAQQSGVAVGVDMVDETALLWGDTPTPNDGRWLRLQPPIPDNAFSRLMQRIDGSSSRLPISWPAGGIASDMAIANWNGNHSFSDYTSHYWDSQDFRDEYYFSGRSLKQIQVWMGDEALFRRLPYIQRNRPQLSLISAGGPFYTKMTNGNQFTPGVDILQRSGIGPEQIMAEIMFAAIAGMAGVRVYNYDTNEWRTQRATAPIGTSGLQTGIAVNSPQWNALAQSFNFIGTIEPLLLQPRISAVDMGANIATTARSGAGGKLLMALNMAEAPQRITANLAPYAVGGTVTRYRLTTDGLVTETVSSSPTDVLTLRPAETIAWVFAAGAATVLAGLSCDPSAFVPPATTTCKVTLSAPAGGAGVSVALSADNPAINLPVSVTVSAGQTTATFTATASAVSSMVTVTLTARAAGSAQTFVWSLLGPQPSISTLVSSASLLDGPIAPGEVITIFGSGLGPQIGVGYSINPPGFVDTTVAGARLLFNGIAAPLLYAQASQMNAVVPYETAGASTVQVQIEYQGVKSNPFAQPLADISPAIFTTDDSGKGQGAILNEDSTLNSLFNPAKRGSIVVFYATGSGQTVPPGVTGKIATDILPKPVLPVSVRIGGVDCEVVYAGAAPQEVAGMLQVNVRVPANVAPGPEPVSLMIGTSSSRAGVVLAVQ